MATAKRMASRVWGRSRMLPKSEPYYDFGTKTTKYSTKWGVYTLQMPRKAKRK